MGTSHRNQDSVRQWYFGREVEKHPQHIWRKPAGAKSGCWCGSFGSRCTRKFVCLLNTIYQHTCSRKALDHSSFEENPGSSLLVKVAPKKDAFCQVTPRVGGFRGGTAQLQQKWTLCSTHCQCFSFPDDLQIEHL